ncbi:BnaC02g47780D [Brassica napus]|uniref:BnaC02g47780D protein n=1 Tax=Brassica napus TaxID=3708 RepID=A0A078IS01_BRANA|nr:BnaC02g47780D [Brassica napus]
MVEEKDHDEKVIGHDPQRIGLREHNTVGWIIRDENGVYKGAAQATGKRVMNPLEKIDILNGKTLHFSFYNWIREIKWWVMKFYEVRFQWTSRVATKCAGKLARSRLLQPIDFVFHNYVPTILLNLLHEDYVKSNFH